ncbi:Mu transposase domain-containing protein [Modicisalibacter luteus]
MKVKLQVLAAEWNSSGLDYYPAEPIQRALERVERCRLNALIKTSDAFTHRKSVKVGLSSHVKYGMVFYSVPYALVGQAVEVEASADRVRVYNGQRLVADHPRQASTYYQTKPAHMRTRGAQVARERSRDRFMSWAIRIGRNTTKWVRTRMDQAEYPEHAYESCRRLLSLANIHGPKRLERACGRRGVRTMDDIRKILSRAD